MFNPTKDGFPLPGPGMFSAMVFIITRNCIPFLGGGILYNIQLTPQKLIATVFMRDSMFNPTKDGFPLPGSGMFSAMVSLILYLFLLL